MSLELVSKSIHVVPLKRLYYGRRMNRADRAIRLIKKYVLRHYKDVDRVMIDQRVNEYVWRRGREKPPRRVLVEIRIYRDEEEGVNIAKVLLVRRVKKTESSE